MDSIRFVQERLHKLEVELITKQKEKKAFLSNIGKEKEKMCDDVLEMTHFESKLKDVESENVQ